jgi:hypothetical protein
MVSFTKLLALFLVTSTTVSAFGLPSPRSILKRGGTGNNVRLPMSDDNFAAEVPRGGEAGSGGGTATIPQEIFNLVKSIAGAGVLSLPAGTFVSLCVSIS